MVYSQESSRKKGMLYKWIFPMERRQKPTCAVLRMNVFPKSSYAGNLIPIFTVDGTWREDLWEVI